MLNVNMRGFYLFSLSALPSPSVLHYASFLFRWKAKVLFLHCELAKYTNFCLCYTEHCIPFSRTDENNCDLQTLELKLPWFP